MGSRAEQPDRYQPLPGLVELPGFLVRKLSPRGRRIAAVAGALFLVAVAAGLAIWIPAIVRAKHDDAAAEARAQARARAARVAQLRAEMRPVRGHGAAAAGLSGTQALGARQALAGELASAVRADALRRAGAGELRQTPVRADCVRYPVDPTARDPATVLGRKVGSYACLAVTAEIDPGTSTRGGTIGYPYRARVDFPTGRFAFCKISGRPGEGSLARTIAVPVPRACGGTG